MIKDETLPGKLSCGSQYFNDETQTNQEKIECEVNDMEEYHMSDMDEQETLINESNSMEYECKSAGKFRNLRIF